MTYAPATCIRGCVRPCHCADCKGKDQPEHPPIPAMADKGHLCMKDWTRLHAWITEVVDLYATLPLVRDSVGGQDESAHRKVSGSPSLIALDSAALQDPSTNRYGYTGADGFVEQEGPMFVPREVIGWGQVLADDLGLVMDIDDPKWVKPAEMWIHPKRRHLITVPRIIYTMTEAVDLLTTFFEQVCEAAWVDELWADMKKIRSALGNAHGEERPKPAGRCLSVHEVDGEMVSCDRMIYLPPDAKSLRCGKCGRKYRGMDALRLAIQAEVEKVG